MSPQKAISTTAWVLIFALATIWGGAIFLASRLALNEVGPLTIVAHRTFWAALLLWGASLRRGASPCPPEARVCGSAFSGWACSTT